MDFLRKYRHVVAGLLILFVALQIPIYWKQDRSLGLPARLLYSLAYYPQSGWARLTEGARNVWEHYFKLVSVAEENDRLKRQNAELRGKVYELREIEQENLRLRSLLGMRERSRFEGVATRVIALDSSSWFQSFTIDVGSDDGIERGMPVVSDEGLVGTVVSVAAKSSKVLPLVDMNSAVDVVDSRSRARGMLVGRGRERAFVNYLERSEDVREGDLLVTSGLGGAFPPGLPVAVVREVRHKTYGLFQDAYVDTIVRFNRLENVMVLRYKEGSRIPAYLPPPPAPEEVTAPALLAVDAPAEAPVEAPPPPPMPVAPAQLQPPVAAPEPSVVPVKPKKKPAPAPKPETSPVQSPLEGGATGLNGPALNLPSIPSAMPALQTPQAEPAKPAATETPAASAVEKPPVEKPPAEKPAEKKSAVDKKPAAESAPEPTSPATTEAPLSGGTP